MQSKTHDEVITKSVYFSTIAANAMGRTFYGYEEDLFSILGHENPLFRAGPKNASIIGSLCEDGMHAPVLDIDFQAQFLELGDGRQELILDVSVNSEQMSVLASVAKEVGISREVGVTNRGRSLRMVLNCPAILVPSETAGHFHLYLETKLFWSQYETFLAVLFRVSVIEQGFYEMSLRNGMSTVTLPWIKREEVLPAGY